MPTGQTETAFEQQQETFRGVELVLLRQQQTVLAHAAAAIRSHSGLPVGWDPPPSVRKPIACGSQRGRSDNVRIACGSPLDRPVVRYVIDRT